MSEAELTLVDRSAYDVTLVLLAAAGLPTRDSRRDEHAFGSWWIEVGTDPPFRIVWDGKDRRAIVQGAVAKKRRQDRDPWEDRWISCDPEKQTPATLVREVCEMAHKGAGA